MSKWDQIQHNENPNCHLRLDPYIRFFSIHRSVLVKPEERRCELYHLLSFGFTRSFRRFCAVYRLYPFFFFFFFFEVATFCSQPSHISSLWTYMDHNSTFNRIMKLNPTCGNTSYTKSMDVNAPIIRVCSCTAATNSYCQHVAIFYHLFHNILSRNAGVYYHGWTWPRSRRFLLDSEVRDCTVLGLASLDIDEG